MKYVAATLGLFIVVGIIATFIARADTVSGAQRFDPWYPGKMMINGSVAWKNVAEEQAALALVAYYRVFEKWPASWGEVVASGIFQNGLYGPQFQVVDPDDKKLDFYYDVVYEAGQDGAAPKLHTLAGKKALTKTLSPPKTYSQRLAQIETQRSTFDSAYWLADVKRLKQLAIMMQLQNAANEYSDLHAYGATGVTDILSCGFSPISATSKSPFTGLPFKFDGSPNDFKFEGQTLKPVDANGKVPSVWNFW